MTTAFFIGLSITLVLLGIASALVGNLIKQQPSFFTEIAGVGIVIFGLYILFGEGFSGINIQKRKPTTILGSMLFGAAIGISWTPCIGPILVAMLILASTAKTVFLGGLLLFFFSIGLSIPLLISSFYIARIYKKASSGAYFKARYSLGA